MDLKLFEEPIPTGSLGDRTELKVLHSQNFKKWLAVSAH